MACILCAGPTYHRFSSRDWRHPSDKTAYRLEWCRACDFGRIAGEFTLERVASFYAGDYYTHGDVPHKVVEQRLSDRLLQHLAWRADNGEEFNALELKNVRTICDIGSGNGARLRELRRRGFQVTGIEPDRNAASLELSDVYVGTAEQLPVKAQFDAVMLFHVLEHCIDPILAIKNAISILKESGSIIVEVPNNAVLGFRRFGASWPWSDIPRHLNFFTEQSLRKLFEITNLNVERTLYGGYDRQYSPQWRLWNEEIAETVGGAKCTRADTWHMLFATMFANPKKKYDFVRMHLTKRQ